MGMAKSDGGKILLDIDKVLTRADLSARRKPCKVKLLN